MIYREFYNNISIFDLEIIIINRKHNYLEFIAMFSILIEIKGRYII